ncbi:MAG: hypothetical protein IJE72_03820 [Clostridia bacterium]|nr:hypothetical protein [Clostridia bacterium]
MKKVLALALALVIALSMSAMAFAAGTPSDATTTVAQAANTCPKCGAEFKIEAEYNKHLAVCEEKHCTKCGEAFANEDAYNEHVAACTVGDTKDYVNLTIKDILDMIIDIAKSAMGQWDGIEDVVIRLVDFIENIGAGVVPEADVNGAIAELEGLNIPGIDGLLDALKAKIKALYAGEEATTVVVTEAEDTPDTGSASVGIAVFAAVSVAAAAAYVCTKKN